MMNLSAVYSFNPFCIGQIESQFVAGIKCLPKDGQPLWLRERINLSADSYRHANR